MWLTLSTNLPTLTLPGIFSLVQGMYNTCLLCKFQMSYTKASTSQTRCFWCERVTGDDVFPLVNNVDGRNWNARTYASRFAGLVYGWRCMTIAIKICGPFAFTPWCLSIRHISVTISIHELGLAIFCGKMGIWQLILPVTSRWARVDVTFKYPSKTLATE